MIERNRQGIVSKIDINALEDKIKGIEAQINEVQMIGNTRKGLDKLEKSLAATSIPVENLDMSLVVDDLEEELIEPPVQEFNSQCVEDVSEYSLHKSIQRLFQFIEVESNISLEKLDGTYGALKTRI